MTGDAGSDRAKPIRTFLRSDRFTLATLANRLADRPWALAFASFAVTAFLIRPDDLGLL
ncbi:hypothetical protein M8312_14300 [Sphingomonas sp. KRR8]|uniref:hypothetical protein n=1 Tax=Sphingomonas sp. KRR8 TaxID=2942996 RepID=UPI00201FC1B1|nr:hypothetical protein [Sphingomonas sp. KRR8]URD60927.1 hypothetical protein M8312_14300 [Sphingomonas sp. KRR8]